MTSLGGPHMYQHMSDADHSNTGGWNATGATQEITEILSHLSWYHGMRLEPKAIQVAHEEADDKTEDEDSHMFEHPTPEPEYADELLAMQRSYVDMERLSAILLLRRFRRECSTTQHKSLTSTAPVLAWPT